MLKGKEWRKVVELINRKVFNALPERLECQDCHDGRAEWIELQQNKKSKRVTFELGQTIPRLEDFLKEMRRLKKENFLH